MSPVTKAAVTASLALWATGGALLGALGVAWRRRRLPRVSPAVPSKPWHAVSAVVLLVLSSAIGVLDAMGTHSPQSPEVTVAVIMPLVWLGLVLGITSLVRRGKPNPHRTARVSFWTMVVVFFLTLSSLANRAAAREKARKGLHVDSTAIRHGDFGFALPHPGQGFRVDSVEAAAMERRLTNQMLVWVFVHDSVPDVLVLTVVDSLDSSEQKFREFAAGVVNGVRKRGGTEVVDTIVWQDSLGEARLAFVAAEGYRGQMRCITSSATERFMRLVCAQTLSAEGDSLGFVRTGLRREKAPGSIVHR